MLEKNYFHWSNNIVLFAMKKKTIIYEVGISYKSQLIYFEEKIK